MFSRLSKRMTNFVWLTLLSLATWTSGVVVVGKATGEEECLAMVKTVLEHNSPELLVISNDDERNIFTSNKIHISVTWSHMDALLTDKSCVASYLLEYGPYTYIRTKRESILSSAQVSPALNPDTVSHNIVLDDDCRVYSVHIAVIPTLSSADLLYSRPRRFWPAAYRTMLDTFSDSAVISWPDSCSYVTSDWQLEACPDGQNDRCAIVRLNGETPIHLTDLQPCKMYHFRLRASQQTEKQFTDETGDILWSFPAAKTLPKPEVDIAAGRKSLRVTIRQGDNCDENAYVTHWRVTHCTQAVSEDDQRKHYYDDGGGPEEEAGSGDDEPDDEEEYYYYDDGVVSKNGHKKCTNKLYMLKPGRKDFIIDGLADCTLYTVDISPADSSGKSLQPGEDFGSVHSTYCMNNGPSTGSDDISFGPDNGKDDLQAASEAEAGINSDAGMPVTYLVLLSASSVLAIGLIFATMVWLLAGRRMGSMAGGSGVKHVRCPSEDEVEASPRRALIRVTDDESSPPQPSTPTFAKT